MHDGLRQADSDVREAVLATDLLRRLKFQVIWEGSASGRLIHQFLDSAQSVAANKEAWRAQLSVISDEHGRLISTTTLILAHLEKTTLDSIVELVSRASRGGNPEEPRRVVC